VQVPILPYPRPPLAPTGPGRPRPVDLHPYGEARRVGWGGGAWGRCLTARPTQRARDRSVTGTERPVDVLDGDPELVVEAASRLATEILI
jgi:hypothetical protein